MLGGAQDRGINTLAGLAFFQPKRNRAAKAVPRASSGFEVLDFLSTHGLSDTPENYAVIHRYFAAPDELLAKAVDALLMGGAALTDAGLAELYASLNPTQGDGGDSGQGERNELRTQARHLAELTARAATANELFGKGLASDLGGLYHAPEPLITQVRGMIERTEATEKQLASALAQIEALRQEVEAERGNAGRDALTGLLNRRGIEPQLAAVEPGDSIAMIDLDHFKQLNDGHGHAVGDRILKVVAASLSESFESHEIARWGGEEFLAVLTRTNGATAKSLIQEASESLKERRFRLRDSGKRIGKVTFSAGLAVVGKGGVEDAIARADAALYDAKDAGRDQIMVAKANN